jgi:hypothetical protein
METRFEALMAVKIEFVVSCVVFRAEDEVWRQYGSPERWRPTTTLYGAAPQKITNSVLCGEHNHTFKNSV